MSRDSLKPSEDGFKQLKDALFKNQRFLEQEFPEKKWVLDSDEWLKNASRLLLADCDASWDEDSSYPPGISQGTWKRFRQGKPILASTFRVYCQTLGLNWEEIIEKENFSHINKVTTVDQQEASETKVIQEKIDSSQQVRGIYIPNTRCRRLLGRNKLIKEIITLRS